MLLFKPLMIKRSIGGIHQEYGMKGRDNRKTESMALNDVLTMLQCRTHYAYYRNS